MIQLFRNVMANHEKILLGGNVLQVLAILGEI
jgi:hypothetical protein